MGHQSLANLTVIPVSMKGWYTNYEILLCLYDFVYGFELPVLLSDIYLKNLNYFGKIVQYVVPVYILKYVFYNSFSSKYLDKVSSELRENVNWSFIL